MHYKIRRLDNLDNFLSLKKTSNQKHVHYIECTLECKDLANCNAFTFIKNEPCEYYAVSELAVRSTGIGSLEVYIQAPGKYF
jgi:hypothetical protein